MAGLGEWRKPSLRNSNISLFDAHCAATYIPSNENDGEDGPCRARFICASTPLMLAVQGVPAFIYIAYWATEE